ncbi:MAG TPA: 4a-hydroxytetrahydrobiopterin dehydratase [Nitrospiria bacterium]|nr:4a-hydroxytetrahydrobiopterin dehydratase [Nitrospiria bacterium]
MKLSEQKCGQIKTGTPPLSRKEAEALLPQILTWSLANKELVREFKFKEFREAMNFVNLIAEIANEQDHHPDILISYNKVRVALSTHRIDGLSMNDFILAAKIDLKSNQQVRESRIPFRALARIRVNGN